MKKRTIQMHKYSVEWLLKNIEKGKHFKYVYFWGHTPKKNGEIGNSCFSQWFESPFVVDGITYNTTEHWMMAQKALLFGDNEAFEKIILAKKPGEAKDLGRKVSGFDEKIWQVKRFEIVLKGNINKFSQHQALKDYLINTGNRVLVEASPVDTIWGVGLAADDERIEDAYSWRGLNLLGFALMETRDYLEEKI